MAWTAPTNVATGDVLTATRYNNEVVSRPQTLVGCKEEKQRELETRRLRPLKAVASGLICTPLIEVCASRLQGGEAARTAQVVWGRRVSGLVVAPLLKTLTKARGLKLSRGLKLEGQEHTHRQGDTRVAARWLQGATMLCVTASNGESVCMCMYVYLCMQGSMWRNGCVYAYVCVYVVCVCVCVCA